MQCFFFLAWRNVRAGCVIHAYIIVIPWGYLTWPSIQIIIHSADRTARLLLLLAVMMLVFLPEFAVVCVCVCFASIASTLNTHDLFYFLSSPPPDMVKEGYAHIKFSARQSFCKNINLSRKQNNFILCIATHGKEERALLL